MEEDAVNKEGRKQEELWAIVTSRALEGIDIFHPALQEFIQTMETKYGQDKCSRSKLWHVLTGSVPEATEIDFDLPGGEVEDFIQNRLPQLQPVEIKAKLKDITEIKTPPPGAF